ncbi:Proline iminopeptidase [Aedoeadaptatus ivorii]|uniref:Proline iminopeptidase n=1 Tax=Aedoeadaptatus ivorii TaxID=54006 RepID=A0A448UZZ9_9FIRM|nr:proline iminopeptidase-family hydrolase [Peptoniphilus ivorii]MDQ0507928.1 proline iminopeptidase [Peptoniphilus ivorii]VEJ34719.1 Proline iminopeptidase [Peptoniphilus ivorii]
MVSVREGRMPFRGFETYYRIANPAGKKAPLVLLHGGPGSTHNYFEGFDKIAETLDRPIVMYDQIGCGESATPGHTELYTAEVWMDELDALREHLSLDKVHLLGQSWGGMLAISYMIERKPAGVLSVALASTLHAAEVWKQEQYRRIEHYMAPEDLSVFHTAEKTGNYDDPAYLDALDRFMDLFCGPTVTDNAPEYLKREKKNSGEVYITGWGANEFSPTGTLSGYDYRGRLHEIDAPVLITSGQMDLSSPYISKSMHDEIEGSRWELFPYSRHMAFVEEEARYFEVLADWLKDFA